MAFLRQQRCEDELLGLQTQHVRTEAEVMLGLPVGFTDVDGLPASKRLHMLGNGIDVNPLTHLLRHLRLGEVPQEEMAVRRPMEQ